jgi:hypothetical protein
MLSAGFEPAIPAIERPHTYALDLTAAGFGTCMYVEKLMIIEKPVACTDVKILEGI